VRAELQVKIVSHQKDSDDTYGSPRITAGHHEACTRVSMKTVAAYMCSIDLAGISQTLSKLELPSQIMGPCFRQF